MPWTKVKRFNRENYTEILAPMIHLLTQGTLKEWNNEVPIGEVHQFDWELFKNSDDTNIQLLVKLIENVEETYQSIQNINAITMEEEGEEGVDL